MDQITTVERELLALGITPGIKAEELRALAKDILWQALEMESAHKLALSLENLQVAYEIDFDPAKCQSVANAIWEIAHDTPPADSR